MKATYLKVIFFSKALLSASAFTGGIFPSDYRCSKITLQAEVDRRSMLSYSLASSFFCFSSVSTSLSHPLNANAVGTIPEFSDANSVLQGITVHVSDPSQKQAMIDFLKDGFGFKVLREQKKGSIEDVWMGFGPEQMSTPKDFVIPVSSFAMNGGHASIHIKYDSESKDSFYSSGGEVPGNSVAYLQVGVPSYRISQMVKNGGDIISAYGFVDVISPAGLPMRAIIGISPDPMMFIAINCKDVNKSREFYKQIGFIEQPYPYARPNNGTGQFEPSQPKNSVYLGPSRNGMGILLLPVSKKSKTVVRTNPVIESIDIVYQTSKNTVSDINSDEMRISDLSGVPISFESISKFEVLESKTRIIQDKK